MKIIQFLLILVILITGNSIGQVSQNIDVGFSEKFPNNNYYFYAYSGRFEFEEIPIPLKPTKVNFILKAGLDDASDVMNEDWDLCITYPKHAAEIIGDSIIHWPGPHKTGDIFKGSFEIIPKASGRWMLSLYPCKDKSSDKLINKNYHGIAFTWCFDEKRNLLLLDRERKGYKEYYPIRTYFFDNDSLTYRHDLDNPNRGIFNYEISFKSLPRIGDTTVLYYTLYSTKDVPVGCNLDIFSSSVDVLTLPGWMNYPINDGMVIRDSLTISPLAVRKDHGIFLHYNYTTPDIDRTQTGQLGCDLIFNEDGSLKYIYYGGHGNVPESEYPKGFRKPNANTDNTSYRLNIDSDKIIKR